MPTIKQSLTSVSKIDQEFVGTVAFRNEKLCLPDGSKVAIGMDRDFWVIVYQSGPNSPFILYEFDAKKHTLLVDKKKGQQQDYNAVNTIIAYFFENAAVEDVVTIEAGGKEI